ncbi:MAG: acyl-CoA thioesterase [Ignavibacteria bacterium]|nr:acyl-CoA thioesterase [Ignavibacteria bacterium]
MKNESTLYLGNRTPLFIESELKVNTYDIDVANHVNNIVYLRWLEDLRNLLFAHICPLETLLKLNYYHGVISTEMKYKKQIVLFDKPIGKKLVHSYSHGIILLKVEIRVNNQIVFTATQKCVVFNLINKRMHKGGIT